MFIGLAKVLGVVGPVALPIIASTFFPALVPIVTTIMNGVFSAEAIHGPGNGSTKFQTVMQHLQTATPLILDALERATGKQLVDEGLFQAGMQKIADGVVDLLNSFGALPKSRDIIIADKPTNAKPVVQASSVPRSKR